MKILGYHYKMESTDKDRIGALGRFHADTFVIQIAENVNAQHKISTVIHEIIEALNYHLELKLEHNVIMALEAGLFQSMMDNGVNLKPLLGEIETSP